MLKELTEAAIPWAAMQGKQTWAITPAARLKYKTINHVTGQPNCWQATHRNINQHHPKEPDAVNVLKLQ